MVCSHGLKDGIGMEGGVCEGVGSERDSEASASEPALSSLDVVEPSLAALGKEANGQH
jgi:hypothetical protein